jgi:biotin carboxylase
MNMIGPSPASRAGGRPQRRDVLLLGWKPQLGEAAIARGLRPVVVYGPAERDWAGAIPEPGCLPVYCGEPGVLAASMPALRHCGVRLTGLAGVCPAAEEYVIPAAEYAALLGLPGLPLATAVAARDKAVQKTLISDAGLPHAGFRLLADTDGLLFGAQKLDWDTYPAVLKPVSGSGTIAATVVNSEEEVRHALARAGGHRPHILEEFVAAAQEWELDGYTEDGQLRFLSAGVYTRPLLDIRDGAPVRLTLLDPAADAAALARAAGLASRALTALGLTGSVFHLELFVRQGDGELVFGECGARPGGSAIPEAVAAKHGIDLFAAHLDLWLGRAVTQVPSVRPDCVGLTQLPASPGTLISQPGEADLLARPGVLRASVQYPRGWSMRSSREGVPYRMGTVVAAGRDRQQTLSRLQEVSDWFTRRVRTGPARPNATPAWVLREAQLPEI